ncbi:hypothetical protein ACQPUZ_01220 [Clostridium tertium]
MGTNYEYNAENFEEILSRLQTDEGNSVSDFNDTDFEREFLNNNFSDIESLDLNEFNNTTTTNNSGCCGNSDDDTFLSDLENDVNLTELGGLGDEFNFQSLSSSSNINNCSSNSNNCSGVVNSRECYERGLREGLEQGFIRGFKRGCQQGRNEGLREGFNRGLERGLSRAEELARASYEKGFRCGFEKGFRAGYQKGFRDGCRAGFERGVRAGFRRGYERAVRDIIRSINENFGSGSNSSCPRNSNNLVTNGNWRCC